MANLVVLTVKLHALSKWVDTHYSVAHLIIDHHVVVFVEVHKRLPGHALHQWVHVSLGKGAHVLAHHHIVVIIHFVVPTVLALAHITTSHHHVLHVSLKLRRHVILSELIGALAALKRHVISALVGRSVCVDDGEAAYPVFFELNPCLIL